MSMKQALITSTALVALALPAQADITPEQAWTVMQTYYANSGITMTAQSDPQGDDLIMRDVVMTMPRDLGDAVLTIPELRLERDGGGVALSMSDTMIAKIPTPSPTAAMGETEITFTQKGLAVNISGDADDMVVDFDIEEFAAEGTPNADMSAGAMLVRVALKDMTGSETIKTGDVTSVASDFDIGAITYTAAGAGAEGGATVNLRGELNDIKAQFEMDQPAEASPQQLGAALANGFKVSGNFTFGETTSSSEVSGPEGTMTTNSAAKSGTLNFALDQSGARYDATSLEAQVDISNAMLPFPVHIELASAAAGIKLPMVANDAANPVGLDLRLESLTVNDEVWAMFDPTAQLPRSPATLVMSLEGMAKVTHDLSDPAAIPAGAMPFELDRLALTELHVAMLGADLTGTGAMTVNNAGPVPVPAGSVDLRLAGGNSLIDKLVATGLVPAEQLLGLRMMLGLFTVPAGDDVLTSKIEMREDGGVYANGQRLR